METVYLILSTYAALLVSIGGYLVRRVASCERKHSECEDRLERLSDYVDELANKLMLYESRERKASDE